VLFFFISSKFKLNYLLTTIIDIQLKNKKYNKIKSISYLIRLLILLDISFNLKQGDLHWGIISLLLTLFSKLFKDWEIDFSYSSHSIPYLTKSLTEGLNKRDSSKSSEPSLELSRICLA